MSAESTQTLIRVINAEADVYARLKSVLQDEQAALLDQDLEALTRAIEAKETLAAEANLLEDSLSELVASTAKTLELELARPRLSEIATALGAEGTAVREAQIRLAALVGAVRELVEANDESTRRSLSQVRATIQLLGRLWPEPPTYGPDSKGEREQPRGGLVLRSA